jgi:hypothetical protein
MGAVYIWPPLFLDFDLEAINRNDSMPPYATKLFKRSHCVDKHLAALRIVIFFNPTCTDCNGDPVEYTDIRH